MADEPPITPETPTPTPEKKSHTGLIITIVLIVIVVLLALFFGLYFGLRNKGGDTPDEVNPDPDIVEPGPEDPDSTGDDGETTHTEHSWVWEHDDEGHWQVCSVCGETTTKNSHTLSYTKGNDTSHTVKCDTCGYEATKEHTLEYVSDGAAGHHQVCSECQYATATVSHDLGSYISDGDDGHYQVCSMCDYKSEGNHTWTETSTTPATCTTEGATYYTCELCGAIKTTVIAALGHEWSSEWSHDATNHWHACTREGCTAKSDETTHTLGEQTKNTDGNYCQTCSVCGYSTDPVAPVATYINVTGDDDLVVHCNNVLDESEPESLDLRNTITVTVLDQYKNEYTDTCGSEYTLSTTSSEIISLNTETGAVTGVSEGTATVTVTSSANTSLTKDIEIKVTEKEYEVESISVSLSGNINGDGYTVLNWGETSSALEVTFTPTYATVQTYKVTPNDETGLFTYNETTNTFTHTKLNTGTETFTITATDQSNSASTTITLECDPVIDEPYDVVWKENALPTEIAKNESIENLDEYVEVHYNHTGQDEHQYVDDTYTLRFVGSDGVTINGTTATFTGNGGTETYITVTATPEHDAGSPVYAQSTVITITQAVTELSLNYTDYKLKSCYSVTLEATFSPDDYYPKDQVTDVSWAISSNDYYYNYVTISPDSSDNTKCEVTSTQKLGNSIDRLNLTITASVGEVSSTCNLMVSDFVFAYDSWEEINYISSLGIARDVYEVGDTKTITIGIETEEYQEHEIRIIDFDHDDLTNTDDNGYDDPDYNNDSNKAAITCEMVDCLSTTHVMNNSDTNKGGWDQCEMRSYLNTDEGCVLSTLDNDLQAVIKKVDKKSTKGDSSTRLGETAASDSLFLLARVEVDGTNESGYVDEGTQYAYWSDHNTGSDRIKYQSGSALSWWLRSPYTDKSYGFRVVNNTGGTSSNYDHSNSEHGVSFAFCI